MNADPLKVALRADASVQIGLGHVKRCLALGQALQDIGAKVCLVARELGVDTASLAGSVSIEYFALPPSRALTSTRTEGNEHQSWTNVGWMEDADATADALSDWVPDLVVVDNYAFDARWHHAVATALNVRIAAVDDLGDRDLDVDWLIDHNHSTDHRAKYAGRVKPGTKMLCGPRYALLAPVYATAKRHVLRPCVESIGVFMGGTDSTGLSNDVVRACREVAGFGGRIEVATTRANPHLAELQAACQRWPLTTLTIDAPDLAAFFAHHDLQIGAGGGATWERCCIGAPTLAVICTDNQRIVIPALVQLDVLATTEPADDSTVELIGRAVSALLQDSERRATLSQRARLMVDGLGARRVALHLAARTLVLRNASAADA